MDMSPCREVHDGISSPAGRPYGLLHLLGDTAGDGRVSDVGIDFTEKVTPDDHRLHLWVIDVRWDDGTSLGDLIADEFGGHYLG